MAKGPELSDSFGRVIRDLRVSLTDRCNFRCLYCLPETEEAANFYRTKFDALKNPAPRPFQLPAWKPRAEILTFEELERLLGLFARLGLETRIPSAELAAAWPFVEADKKRASTRIRLPVVTGPGESHVRPVALDELRAAVLASAAATPGA